MTFNFTHLQTFYDRKIVNFTKAGDIQDFANSAARISEDYDDEISFEDRLRQLLQEPGIDSLKALVVGPWFLIDVDPEKSPANLLNLLIENKDKIPQLQALFIGDITYEESELSWIVQTDMLPLWAAFPQLKQFAVRGSNDLSLGDIKHDQLDSLIIQSGGLDKKIVAQALAAEAPLVHLELWLGAGGYGADTSVDDFEALLAGQLFPRLKRLGLCNSEYTDALAEALAQSALLERLEVLDLSMGTLTKRGAQALIASGKLSHLKQFVINHHYVEAPVLEELRAATPNLVADEPLKPGRYGGRYSYSIAVSE